MKKPDSIRQVVSGRDALLTINIFAPECVPKEFRIKIPNLQGNEVLNKRTPEVIHGVIVNALRKKYGDKVK